MLEGLTKYFNVNLNVKECVYINCGFSLESFLVRCEGQRTDDAVFLILIFRYARWDLVFMRCEIRKHLKKIQ